MPVVRRIGSDSANTCRITVNKLRRLHHRLSRLSNTSSDARVVVRMSISSRKLATNNAGSVTTSPTAETSGALTSSKSQPRSADRAARPRVTAISTKNDSRAPTADRTTRSATATTESRPKTGERIFVSTASITAVTSDKTPEASTFWATKASGRRDIRNVPAWIEVARRLPSAPKMLPRIPIAAGTNTRRPGCR